MVTPRRLGAVLVTGLVVLGGATVPATGGGAHAGPTRAHRSDIVRSPAPTGDARARALLDYWTPTRMAAAQPVDELLGLTSVDRSTTTAPEERRRLHVPSTVGRLFFTTSAGDASCTASTIRTRKRNQVITAGHCVHTGPEGIGLLGTPEWFSNWVFVPRYHNGVRPFGRWISKNAYAFRGWVKDGSFSRDQAIIKFEPRNGRKLTQVVGANRVRTGLNQVHRGVRIWGWPAEGRYDGETAVHCDGRTTHVGRSKDAKMRCPMNGGASGGPWLLRSQRRPDTGLVWAVTSRRTLNRTPKYLLAVPLPDAVRRMMRSIN